MISGSAIFPEFVTVTFIGIRSSNFFYTRILLTLPPEYILVMSVINLSWVEPATKRLIPHFKPRDAGATFPSFPMSGNFQEIIFLLYNAPSFSRFCVSFSRFAGSFSNVLIKQQSLKYVFYYYHLIEINYESLENCYKIRIRALFCSVYFLFAIFNSVWF